MYCKNCGAELNENAKFCPKCGTPQERALSEQTPAEPVSAESAPAEPVSAESAPTEPVSAEPTPAPQAPTNQTINMENAISGTQKCVEEGKNIISKLFSKDPFSIFDGNKDNVSNTGVIFVVIHVLLFAFVTCHNSTGILNYFINAIKSKAGLVASMMNIELPVNYKIFLPLCGIACAIALVECIGIYLFMMFFKQKPKSILNIVNTVGLAYIPMIMALVLNFIAGMFFPLVTVPVFAVAFVMHMIFLHRGIKSLLETEKALIWEFCILLLIFALIAGIICSIVLNHGIDTLFKQGEDVFDSIEDIFDL